MLGIELFIASIGINELMRSTVRSREQKKAEQRRENRIEAFNKDKGIIEALLAKDITEMNEEDISILSAAIIRIKGTAGNLGESSFTETARALEARVQSMQEARIQDQQAVMDDEDADRKPSGDEVNDTEGHGEQSEEEESGTADLTGHHKAVKGELEDEENFSEDGYDFVRSDEITEDPVLVALDPNTGGVYSSDEGRYPNSSTTGMPTKMPSSAPSAMPTYMPLGISSSTQFMVQSLGMIDDMRNYDFSEPVTSVLSYIK